MVAIKVFYGEPTFGKSIDVYNLLKGVIEVFDIGEHVYQIEDKPTLFLENSPEFIRGWEKAVSVADGNRINWIIGAIGLQKSFYFSGIPIAKNQDDLTEDKQGVKIIQITNPRWENISFSDLDIRHD